MRKGIHRHRRPFRRYLTIAALIAVLFAQVRVLPGLARSMQLIDFVEYWAASRLFLARANPYSPAAMLAIERSVGWNKPAPVMMLTPPWTLPLVAPLGLLPLRTAQLIWLALCFLALFVSADCLWKYFGGDRKRRWISWLLAAIFVPNIVCLHICQLSVFILAGITAFLICEQRRPLLAGVALFALGLKPHLLYLVALAILLFIVGNHCWRMLAGASLAYCLSSLIALLVVPAAFTGYLHASTAEAMNWVSALGGTLRMIFGSTHYWLQFMPSIPGLVWLAFRWRRSRAYWDWKEQMPALLLASTITASYGWMYDQVVLMPAAIAAVLAVGARPFEKRLLPAVAFIIIELVLVIADQKGIPEHGLVWSAPMWALVYAVSMREARRTAAPLPTPLMPVAS